jgi:hypothetical protein
MTLQPDSAFYEKEVPVTDLTDAEILVDIRTKLTVPVWPHYAWAHGCSRGTAYEIAKAGGPEFIRVGRLIRVVTAALRTKLGIDA